MYIWEDADVFLHFRVNRLYSGVDWSSRIPPTLPPPRTTVELQPDMVSYRFANKRYAPKAETWQVRILRIFLYI